VRNALGASRVQVVVRVRPQLAHDADAKSEPAVNVDSGASRVQVTVPLNGLAPMAGPDTASPFRLNFQPSRLRLGPATHTSYHHVTPRSCSSMG